MNIRENIEEIFCDFKDYSKLSITDSGNMEYIIINNEVIYLNTIKINNYGKH